MSASTVGRFGVLCERSRKVKKHIYAITTWLISFAWLETLNFVVMQNDSIVHHQKSFSRTFVFFRTHIKCRVKSFIERVNAIFGNCCPSKPYFSVVATSLLNYRSLWGSERSTLYKSCNCSCDGYGTTPIKSEIKQTDVMSANELQGGNHEELLWWGIRPLCSCGLGQYQLHFAHSFNIITVTQTGRVNYLPTEVLKNLHTTKLISSVVCRNHFQGMALHLWLTFFVKAKFRSTYIPNCFGPTTPAPVSHSDNFTVWIKTHSPHCHNVFMSLAEITCQS